MFVCADCDIVIGELPVEHCPGCGSVNVEWDDEEVS